MAFNKRLLTEGHHRRQEPVELDGGTVWVREEIVACHLETLQLAQRPAIDPRGGVDLGAAITWQILFSLYEGPEPEAKRVFDESEISLIYRFRREEFDRITAAMRRVNGETEEETQAWEAFTGASEVAQTSR